MPEMQLSAPHESGHRVEDPPKLEVVVRAIKREAEGVLMVTLARADGQDVPAWEPGAHIDVILPSGLERQYSLCSDPAQTDHWGIAVLREAASRGGSEWIHTSLRTDDRLTVRGPRNNFPLIATNAYLFIAGGIGITPMLPMLRRVTATGVDWRLIYGGRRRSAMAFTEELAAYGSQVSLWPEDEQGLLPLADVIGAPRPNTAVYCCGPEPLLEAVEKRCADWPAGALRVERFKPRPGALEGVSDAFEVVLKRSGVRVSVAAGQTIVEAVEAAGVSVPTSCREGTCGTCETEVIDGIPDHRDSFLMEDEKAENATMMICCSRSLTPCLVLDL
jgi:ferredoxin-NADP reductase